MSASSVMVSYLSRNDETREIRSAVLFILAVSLLSYNVSGSCHIVAGYCLDVSDNEVRWDITNCGSRPLTICKISLAWPESGGALRHVELGDRDIFSRSVPWSAGPATISRWDLGPEGRTIDQGQTERLGFHFDGLNISSDPNQYRLYVTFCEGGTVQFQACDVPRFNLTGGCSLSISHREVFWDITNKGNCPVTICSMDLSWPDECGDLDQVHLGAERISSQSPALSGGIANISIWDGGPEGRTIGQGQTATLRLGFTDDPSRSGPGQYKIHIRFCQGSDIEYMPVPRICDLVAGNLSISPENRTAHMDITNWGNCPVTICRIRLSVSEELGGLRLIKVDEGDVYSGGEGSAEVLIPGGDDSWIGGEERRRIGQGETRRIQFHFGDGAQERYYAALAHSLRVDLCPCLVELCPLLPAICLRCTGPTGVDGPKSSMMCGISGPDAVCIDLYGRYEPALYNAISPERYTYDWWVDEGAVYTGDSFSLMGSSYQEGNHTLHLSVRDGIDRVCNHSRLVKISPAPSFTIARV